MSGSRCVSSVALTCLVVLCPVAGAGAADSAVAELTKMLPEDVVSFVASGGAAPLEGDFQKTALARLWNDPGLRTFAASIKTELLGALEREVEDEEVPKMIAMGLEYAQVVLGRPMVVGLARVEVAEGPAACVFAILDAGESRPELAAAVTKVETLIGEDEIAEIAVGSVTLRGLEDSEDVPLYWGWIGNYLVLAVNDAQGKAVAHVVRPRTTATGHLAKLPGHGGLLAGYLDVRKLLDIVKSVVESEGGQKDLRLFEAVLEELGLSRLGQVMGKVGFLGPHVVTDSFVEVTGPRSGLPAAFKPIDVSLFGMVDSRAARATAFNIDLAGLYDTVMKVIETASPDEAYPDIQKGLSEFESEAGLSIREGLLASLGGPVVVYQLPAGKMVEAPMGGFVVIAKLNDAALFEETLVQITGMVVGASEEMLQVGSQKMDDGRTIHVWANPALSLAQMMPSWLAADDYVVVGSNVALCQMGVKLAADNGEGTTSLLEAAGFKAVAARLPERVVSLTYSDSQAVLTQVQMQAQQLWPMATMFASRAGIRLPVMVPSVGHIVKDLEPSREYTYQGPDGYYCHYEGVGIELSLRSVAGTSFGVGVLLPALARVRQIAFRMTSGENLSQIGKACLIYADDHDDKLPPNLEVLVEAGALPAKCLESKRRPDDFVGPSYVYIPGQTLEMRGNIVAYEDTRYCWEGVNVLFLDSHVEFMKPEAFRRALKETYERLGREMPEIRFVDEMEADWETELPGPV